MTKHLSHGLAFLLGGVIWWALGWFGAAEYPSTNPTLRAVPITWIGEGQDISWVTNYFGYAIPLNLVDSKRHYFGIALTKQYSHNIAADVGENEYEFELDFDESSKVSIFIKGSDLVRAADAPYYQLVDLGVGWGWNGNNFSNLSSLNLTYRRSRRL